MDNYFGLRESDLQTIIAILQQENEIEEAIIFGSRAKGNYKNGSDVDIVLKGEKVNHQLINQISYLLNEETLMPYKFDVLDYNTVSNKHLVEHIDRAGKTFWKKNTQTFY
ncbi:MAG: nucleotidyltransferase domain-containing protein [Bacteroidia bacterium]